MVMGAAASKLEKALGDQFPEGELYFGLENCGNTCYCNSVVQALYFCIPFREHLLDYYTNNKNNGDAEENILTCLAILFTQEAQKRMKIKKPPHILVIHLKRFKYMEQLSRYKKMCYRVVFPMELKLSSTVEDADSDYSVCSCASCRERSKPWSLCQSCQKPQPLVVI